METGKGMDGRVALFVIRVLSPFFRRCRRVQDCEAAPRRVFGADYEKKKVPREVGDLDPEPRAGEYFAVIGAYVVLAESDAVAKGVRGSSRKIATATEISSISSNGNSRN